MSNITKTLAATIATALLGAGAFTACGVEDATPVATSSEPQTSDAAGYTYIFTILDEPVQEPETLQVDNSDFVRTLEDLEWSDWGSEEATATGTMVADSRTETGEGRLVTYPVEIVVSDLVEGEALQTYSRLTTTATGDAEGYPETEEFALNSVEEAGPMDDPAEGERR